MKRILLSMLALLLALSMLLVGCNEEPSTPNGDDPDNGGGQNPPAQTTTFTKTENYMPAEIFEQMKTYFESNEKGFLPYSIADRPYVGADAFGLSGSTLKSITIPVFNTGKLDHEGNLTLSLYVLSNQWASLMDQLNRKQDPIVLKINAAEYGLQENQIAVRKLIKVDLSDYNIKLTDKQTIGVFSPTDTLIPAIVQTATAGTNGVYDKKSAPAKYYIDNWKGLGFYYPDPENKSRKIAYTSNSLFFDFELERTYESEAAYNAMIAEKAQADAEYAEKLAAVKAAYAGKSISLIGDSISTYSKLSNNPDYHPTLSLNAGYYSPKGTLYDYTKTYWGRLCAEADMELCVINAWAGGKVFGQKGHEGKDSMLVRSYNLNTITGKTPDIIFLYYGTNDTGTTFSSTNDASSSLYTGNMATGDLYQRLSATDKTKTDKEIVAEWFAEVQAYAEAGGYKAEDPRTITFSVDTSGKYRSNVYVCWEAAYALSIQNVKRLYGDAEVFAFTLMASDHNKGNQPRLDRVNTVIRALAEYFEIGLVDIYNCGFTHELCLTYGSDIYGLHPNSWGHALMTKQIVKTLYEKLPK